MDEPRGLAASVHDVARRAKRWQSVIVEPVLSVVFPPRCVGCGDFESYLCRSCRATLDAIGPDSCPRCGEPGPAPLAGGRCARCMGREMPYMGARSAFVHQGAARRLVADFKYGGQPVLGRVMAELGTAAFVDLLGSITVGDGIVVTWVPCHPAASRKRGYNQAEVLARALAAGVPHLVCAGLARKVTPTRHQQGLGREGRQDNLRGAFTLDDKARHRLPPEISAVVLVDDVYTTGATAREVSSVLVKGVGLPVYVFTFSRAVSGVGERHD